MATEAPYTTVASSMLIHAELLKTRMGTMTLGPSRRVLEVMPPNGPSSNSGMVARQPLTLSTSTEKVVCGWVDFSAARAELRDHLSTKQVYEARYRKRFDVTEAEYSAWLRKLFAALRELDVAYTVTGDEVATDPAAAADMPNHIPVEPIAPDQTSSNLGLIAGVLVAGLLISGAIFYFWW